MMLAGIKTGKKKRKVDEPDDQKRPLDNKQTSNLSVAEEIKRQLAQSNVVETRESLTFGNLQRHGRIGKSGQPSEQPGTVVLMTGAALSSDRPAFVKQDYRNGSRKGKLKRSVDDAAHTTIYDMLQEEKCNTRSMDEQFARNVARVGSRYKGTESKNSHATGADEDEMMDTTMYQTQRLTAVASQQREHSRQVAHFDKQNVVTSKCSWWIESSSFQKHMMIALGNHVCLSMAPSQGSLFPGDHVYLVPIAHADAMVGCEDDVWNEIFRFQQALRRMYAKEQKGVIFIETVLPSTKGLWQTRVEAIPVPRRIAEDAPMYFKSALMEQAEEWGTHTKLLSTKDKGLRRTIPKTFPYFFVEWEAGNGFAQIIETGAFPNDFGVNTLAGMMQMDPVRFRRKQRQSFEEERRIVLDFCSRWKAVDWTTELES